MAGNNRNTVWNMDTARGIARRLCGAMAVLAVAAWSQFAVAQGTARLTAVEVLPMQGSTLQVRLRTDGTAPQPLTFTIDKPARISVDLPDVGLALENRRIDVGAGGVDNDRRGRSHRPYARRVQPRIPGLLHRGRRGRQRAGDDRRPGRRAYRLVGAEPRGRRRLPRARSRAWTSGARRKAPAASWCSSPIPRSRRASSRKATA